MRLGEIIREYRNAHAMTTADFARLAGLSRPYVYMLEVNKNTNGGKPIVPSTATLLKISKVLNIPVADLIDESFDDAALTSSAHSEDESNILDQYRRLNDADKRTIRIMMDRFLQAPYPQAAPA